MRLPKEIIQQPKFPEQFQSGGVNGIASKIAEEILVLFKNQHIHTRAREEKSQHHTGRTSTGDATPRPQSLMLCSCACLFIYGDKLIDPEYSRNGVVFHLHIAFLSTWEYRGNRLDQRAILPWNAGF